MLPRRERRALLSAELVADLSTGTLGSSPGAGVVVGDTLYWTAVDGRHGRELWASDGTAASTALVKDLNPNMHSHPDQLTDVNGTLYFMAGSPLSGSDVNPRYTLWRTDGTAAGTVRVVDAEWPQDVVYGDALYNANGTLYFRRGTISGETIQRYTLYRTDPSRSDAVLVTGFDFPGGFVAAAGQFFFSATSPSTGRALWRTDGTAAGTVLVHDYVPTGGAGSEFGGAFAAAGDTLFVIASAPETGVELWKVDVSNLPATVSGTLFNDINGDGRRVWSDTPLSGWRVNVYRVEGGVRGALAGTALTDAASSYVVTGLDAAESPFEVEVVTPDGWTVTSPTGGYRITLGRGAHAQGLHFGAVLGSVVTGAIYDDTNLDGAFQFRNPSGNDAALSQWLVYVDLNGNGARDGGEPVVSASNPATVYRLPPIPTRAEPYQIRAVAPAGYSAVSPRGALWTLDLSRAGRVDSVDFGFAALPAHGVVGRHVARNAPAGAAGAANVMPGKRALLPGGAAGFENVVTDARGLTGIAIDVTGIPGDAVLSHEDFDFAVTSGAPGGAWSAVLAQASVRVDRGGGVAGSDRVTLSLPENAVRNTWLRITVKATASTGLSAPDLFYFGNLVGDTGASGVPTVNAIDLARTRANVGRTSASALAAYDFDRDGVIDAGDVLIVRNNLRRTLPLSVAPAIVPAGVATASALRETVVAATASRGTARPPRRGLLDAPPRDLLA